MDPAPAPKPTFLQGLTKILHLHRLPATAPKPVSSAPVRSTNRTLNAPIPPVELAKNNVQNPLLRPAGTPSSAPVRATAPIPSPVTRKEGPVSKGMPPAPMPSAPSTLSPGAIITDYDRILDLVRSRGSMKLDEIARLLALPEEPVAQELQTLEDNGLVEVKYPAFGEPVIFYKKQEGS